MYCILLRAEIFLREINNDINMKIRKLTFKKIFKRSIISLFIY